MMGRNVVIFTKFFWPEGGGAELATHAIVERILSRVFDTVVVSSTSSPSLILAVINVFTGLYMEAC